MNRGPRRPRRSAEGGFTLVEMLVAIVLVSIGVVGITYAIASTQRSAAINQQQAQLESAMRQVTDYIRDSNATTGIPYNLVRCASASTYNILLAPSGAGALGNRPTRPAGLDWTVLNVYESTSGNRDGVATTPITTTGCPPGDGDWGVQEIVVKVCTPSCGSATETLKRTVWKADA